MQLQANKIATKQSFSSEWKGMREFSREIHQLLERPIPIVGVAIVWKDPGNNLCNVFIQEDGIQVPSRDNPNFSLLKMLSKRSSLLLQDLSNPVSSSLPQHVDVISREIGMSKNSLHFIGKLLNLNLNEHSRIPPDAGEQTTHFIVPIFGFVQGHLGHVSTMTLFAESKLIEILHSINDLNACIRSCKGGAKGVRLDAPIIMVPRIQHLEHNKDVLS